LSSPDRVARAVFALLVFACFVAFFVTQRLKHIPTAVQRFEMTPSFAPAAAPGGHLKQERISFKLAHGDQVTVTIVDSADNDVATLVRDHPVPAYKQFSLRWNGRLGEARSYTILTAPDGHTSLVPANRGALAPAGDYRVRVVLRKRGGSVLSPRSFALSRG
jgi:hypothetical protein